ncbi:hypothetical protein Q4511_16310 [Paracoccus sp. 1_MG-2023]|uniref:hypothetical protein n=1 Tax=unclassified Paracoccus (in: a-proteobacteria) TaxID=2688777 RepID=UPI001C08C669|nr:MULTISPECIES: hypothetical protein [unclassified Paracoccus (in: a-proteobacteria)]MBU2956034.1 hypothetical protein [Paracoccus sp. C2R09]MDO6670468.1 hypothetical protein [Paracoccus sp. 1_MG-2023]
MTWQSVDGPDLLLGAVAICGTGVMLHLLVESPNGSRPIEFMMMAPVIILLLLMMAFGGSLITSSMIALGIRSKPGQLVTITSSSHEQIQALATAEALTVKAEQIDEDQWLYPTATVLWSGLGGPATVKFEGERHDLRMTLPEADIRISSIELRREMPIMAPFARTVDTNPASQ